jgi:hypothetical protein
MLRWNWCLGTLVNIDLGLMESKINIWIEKLTFQSLIECWWIPAPPSTSQTLNILHLHFIFNIPSCSYSLPVFCLPYHQFNICTSSMSSALQDIVSSYPELFKFSTFTSSSTSPAHHILHLYLVINIPSSSYFSSVLPTWPDSYTCSTLHLF